MTSVSNVNVAVELRRSSSSSVSYHSSSHSAVVPSAETPLGRNVDARALKLSTCAWSFCRLSCNRISSSVAGWDPSLRTSDWISSLFYETKASQSELPYSLDLRNTNSIRNPRG